MNGVHERSTVLNQRAKELSKEPVNKLIQKLRQLLAESEQDEILDQEIRYESCVSLYSGSVKYLNNAQVSILLTLIKALLMKTQFNSNILQHMVKYRSRSFGSRLDLCKIAKINVSEFYNRADVYFLRSGKGTEKFIDGSFFTGYYENDCINGLGKATLSNSLCMEGFFSHGICEQRVHNFQVHYEFDEIIGGSFNKIIKQCYGKLDKENFCKLLYEVSNQGQHIYYLGFQNDSEQRILKCINYERKSYEVIDFFGHYTDAPLSIRYFDRNVLQYTIIGPSYESVFKAPNYFGKIINHIQDEEYTGNLKDVTVKHGIGKLTTELFVYTGEFQDNKMHGHGIFQYNNENITLDGYFQNDQYHRKVNVSTITKNMIQNQIEQFEHQPYKNSGLTITQLVYNTMGLNDFAHKEFKQFRIDVVDFYIEELKATYSGTLSIRGINKQRILFSQKYYVQKGVLLYYNHDQYSRYDGELFNFKFHGEGKLILKSGDIKEGIFQHGVCTTVLHK